MSINLPSDWRPDVHGDEVNTLVTENAFFSSLNSLVEYRRHNSGLTKTTLAERLGKDKGSITKITNQPTNMKISTIARLAYAMNAKAVLIFVANENANVIFTPTGIRDRQTMQVISSNAASRSIHSHLGFDRNWIDQHKDSAHEKQS